MMDKYENGPPIQTIFNGANYLAWSQAMHTFHKGKKAWRYVTGDITIPIQQSEESKEKLQDHLEEWDSKNHQAIMWFHNSWVPSINVQFGQYEIAKEVWDLLASWFTTADLAHQYQILNSLTNLKQEQGQLVADFLSQMQSLWDQLALVLSQSELSFYIVFLCSLENAIAKLIFEETRLGIRKKNHFTDAVLAVPHSSTTNQSFWKFCCQSGHMTKDCTKLQNFTCQHCHQKGHYSPQYCKKRSGSHPSQFSPHHFAAVTFESSSDIASTTSTSELESLLKQVLSRTSSPSTALSVTPDSSLELTQPPPATNVLPTEVQSEETDTESPTFSSSSDEPVYRSTQPHNIAFKRFSF
ncbi:hypothetical protein NE237_003272 [Protea cynaroides]|uniref:Retrotransposon Copia-like N-terminal domain-containing protein n=1 Tax=Protea cynaroides TaxID=273540 RepID=A0A9Q0KGE4_9MAGN|nr:hypothetical protein NE237_003272 [Protea cynaroides]